MNKSFNGVFVRPVVLCQVILVVFLVAMSIPMSSQSPAFAGRLKSATMTVEAKTDDAIVSRERHFVVNESTVILDASGRGIELADIPVPSKVEVEYELIMDQDPLCLKIVVE
jgi:hypothetical protein